MPFISEGGRIVKAKCRLLALILAMLLLANCGTALAADDGYASTYTYNYDDMSYDINCSDGSREHGVLAANK